MIVFRFTEPELKRPYRVWITTPVLFCMVALFLCTTPFIEAPIESLIALGSVLLAIPIWVVVKYKSVFSKGFNGNVFIYFFLHFFFIFMLTKMSVHVHI